jgi:transposase
LDTGEPFLIFSFDESSQQFSANNIRVWSLTKPKKIKDTNMHKCNIAGAYSLTPEGNDYLEFLEDSTKESIVKYLERLRIKNFKGVILLLIDNFSSHISNLVKEQKKRLNMELCYLPPYSPQLQPEEKIWYEIKRKISEFKVDTIENYKQLKKAESKKNLFDLVEKSFYEIVESKNKWNKVLNNYIKPIIKQVNPENNLNLKIQKIY